MRTGGSTRQTASKSEGAGSARPFAITGRFGLFFLNGGSAAVEEILPAAWTREATTPKVLRGEDALGVRIPLVDGYHSRFTAGRSLHG